MPCHPLVRTGWRFAVALLALGTAAAQNLADIVPPDPQAHLRAVLRNPRLRNTDGEHFCWHARAAAGDFVAGYEAFGDARWLEAAVEYFQFYLDRLEEDPDGYPGWIGGNLVSDPNLRADALVGDALLLEPLLHFAEVVRSDPALTQRFGDRAQAYVDLARRIGWEKWNHRGTYTLDQGRGSYRTHGRFVDGQTGEWVDRPSAIISDNLNKHYTMGIVLLRLHRLTGEEPFRERVEQIFRRVKTMFRYFPEDDRVAWNFWMPHGPYDIEGRTPRSWVGVHPAQAGYQAGEVSRFVEVYDSGLVFDEADIRRLINANRWMAAGNGWRSSDGTTNAGTLWSGLARFDDSIADPYLAGLRRDPDNARNRIHLAHYLRVVAPLGWTRRYVQDTAQVRVFDYPPQPGRSLAMTEVIPGTIELANNDRTRLATQTRVPGRLRIELLDPRSGRSLGVLHEEDVGEGSPFVIPTWDGTRPDSGQQEEGDYLVAWTLDGERRTAPVSVRVGQRREEDPSAAALRPGQTLAQDFTGALDPRWELEGAEVSDTQATAGGRSLRLGQGNRATLRFGGDASLPVRVRVRIWDAGTRHGTAGTNGPMWGVQTGDGDIFVIRQTWRGYLAGDRDYSWTNTGQNRWFNVLPTRVPRHEGWSEWVFDFSDPEAPVITGNGRPIERVPAEWFPRGAVALYFAGGDQRTGDLFVDDIRIEYPTP